MIIPYRVDVPYDRRPFTNWLIVMGLIAAFSFQVAVFTHIEEKQTANVRADREPEDEVAEVYGPVSEFFLDGWETKGLLGHMWLHAGLLHLIGNLIFLWVFGNAVCAKVGNMVYLPAYVGFGLIAGASHLMFKGGIMIGASGAINGVVGMFLVFFPENEVSCLWMLFFPYGRRFSISSYWMILMWFAFDIAGLMLGKQGVAYFAHLGGFISGAALAIIMLKKKWVGVEKYEKSLLQLMGLEKEEPAKFVRRDLGFWQRENLPCNGREKGPEPAPPERTKLKAAKLSPEPKKTDEGFIRFACSCGKRFKAPLAFAGKMGQCPKCKSPVRIPQEPLT